MTRSIMSAARIAACVASVVLIATIAVAQEGAPVTVYFSGSAAALNTALVDQQTTLSFSMTEAANSSNPAVTPRIRTASTIVFPTGGLQVQTLWVDARMEVGRTYTMSVNYGSNPATVNSGSCAFTLKPPAGYKIEIEDVIRSTYFSAAHLGAYSVRILPAVEETPIRAGTAQHMSNGHLNWGVSLGSLPNGSSAGSLMVIDSGFSSDWSALVTPTRLSYSAPASSGIGIYKSPSTASWPEIPGALRQVFSGEVLADIVTLPNTVSPAPSTAYEIRLYARSAVDPLSTGFPYGITGSPFVVYKIEQIGTGNKLQITSKTYNGGYPASPLRTALASLERTGTWPNFVWTANDWNTSGQAQLVQDVRTGTGFVTNNSATDYSYSCSHSMQIPGGAVAVSGTTAYQMFPWGEEVVSETSAGRTTNYLYYTDPNDQNSYSRLKSMSVAGGGPWEAYEYFGTGGGGIIIHRPYQSSPSSPPATLAGNTTGVVTTYSYVTASTLPLRLSQVQTTINGTAAGLTTFQYNDFATTSAFAINGKAALRSTRSDSADASTQLATVVRYYDGNNDGLVGGRLFSVEQPDKSKTVYVYQFGTWDGTSFTKGTDSTVFGTLGINCATGLASRICVLHGTTDASGTAQATYQGYSLVSTADTVSDNFYVVAGRSTMDVTIRDANGRVVHTESQVWDGSAWQSVSSTNLGYDSSGFLTSSVSSNNATASATYTGELKISETDPAGVNVTYAPSDYDAAGRPTKATRVGYGAIPGVVTAFAYDAASRVISQTVGSGGTETLVTSTIYDSLGRITSQAVPGQGTTTIAYDATGLVRTITLPSPISTTRVETMNADGSPASVTSTNSGVVPQYFSYSIESDGRRHTRVDVASNPNARYSEAWTDWLGRPLQTSRPGFSPTGQAAFVEQNFYDPTTGLLARTTRTGSADLLYQYDSFGALKRSGLDVTVSTPQVLDPATNDRIVDRSIIVANNPGDGWWVTETTTGYLTDNNGTGTPVSVVKTRLSGFPANRLAETTTTDVEGNTTTRTVDVSLSTRQVTTTTSTTGISNPSTEIQVDGLTTSTTGFDGLTFGTTYDALLRPSQSTDPRKGASIITYVSGTALVDHVLSPATKTVHYSYDGAGRVTAVQNEAGKFTRTNYDTFGRVYQQWGDAVHPAQHEYNSYGEENKLTTWAGTDTIWTAAAWPTNPPAAASAATQWTYDAASGLLVSKSDASANTVTYDYYPSRQVKTRTWARLPAITTTYGYDGATGELTSQTYSDNITPNLTYAYYRSGQLKTVQDVTGTRTFTYDSTHPWRLDREQLGAYYGGRWLSPLYETTGSNPVVGRAAGFQLGTSSVRNAELEQDWQYEPDTSRLSKVLSTYANSSANTRTFTYGYYGASDLIGTLNVTNSGGVASPFSVTRGYEDHRDLMTLIQSNWSGAPLAQFDYAYTDLGQRDWEKRSGSSYSIDAKKVTTKYIYNDRGELLQALGYLGENPADPSTKMPNLQFEYGYDNAGNRTSANQTGDSSRVDSFAPDTGNLNRLASRDNRSVIASGTSGTGVAVQVKLDNGTVVDADRQGSYWSKALTPANTAAPDPTPVVITGNLSGAVRTEARVAPVGLRSQVFTYDADGNLTGDGVWTYTWDAENRLTHAATTTAARNAGFPATDVSYAYDYLNRRTLKRAIVNGVETARGYLSQGWTVIAEYDATGGTSIGGIQRSYTWGLDLAGSLGDTGGVGGLLQLTAYDAGASYLPAYDAKGNVMALYDAATGTAAAIYEYSPFGELLRGDGAYAKLNPIRFGTEFSDDETGLIYYGQRYYAPALGRFIGKDPIEEAGGLNLHAFVGNDPINRFDVLGMGDHDTVFHPTAAGSFDPFPNLVYWMLSILTDNTRDDSNARAAASQKMVSDDQERRINLRQGGGILGTTSAADREGIVRQNVAPNRLVYGLVGFVGPRVGVGLAVAGEMTALPLEVGGVFLGGLIYLEKNPPPRSATDFIYGGTPRSQSTTSDLPENMKSHRLGVGVLLQDQDDNDLWSEYLMAASTGQADRAARILSQLRDRAARDSKKSGSVHLTRLYPKDINFSQRNVASDVQDYTDDMAAGQWDWSESGPIRVMMRDGQWVAYDNRRLMAAQNAGLASIPVQIVQPNEIAPGDDTWEQQFQNNRFKDPRNLLNGVPMPNIGLPSQPIVRPSRPR